MKLLLLTFLVLVTNSLSANIGVARQMVAHSIVESGSCENVVKNIEGYYIERSKSFGTNVSQKELISSFCQQASTSKELCAQFQKSRNVEDFLKGYEVWSTRYFSKKKISKSDAKKLIKRIDYEDNLLSNLVKVARYEGKETAKNTCVDYTEFLMILKISSMYDVKVSAFFEMFEDSVREFQEDSDIRKYKKNLQGIVDKCVESKNTTLHLVDLYSKGKAAGCSELTKVSAKQISRDFCSGGNDFLCKWYKESLYVSNKQH